MRVGGGGGFDTRSALLTHRVGLPRLLTHQIVGSAARALVRPYRRAVSTDTAADPRPSLIVMIATYVAGGIGVFLGFSTIMSTPPSLTWACLLAVGAGGLLSFIRHSLLHRSDAARMGWDYGKRNNFQIEVGLANLAWGLVAILVVVMDAGIAAEGAVIAVFGCYLTAVAVMNLVAPGGQRRALGPGIAISVFGLCLLFLGIRGLAV